MMKTKTAESYRKRLVNVVDYIYQNIDSDLDVNNLADVACMSPYHFHRIYREIAQETINTTVRRLRLQRAAAMLIQSDKGLPEIAKLASYGSHEAFSRAFSKHFGESPACYRERRKESPSPLEPFIASLPLTKQEPLSMNNQEKFDVAIEPFTPVNLIGLKHQGDYMEVGQAFEKLYIYAGTNRLINNETRSFGLYYDDPQSVETKDLRSVACISVPEDVELTGGTDVNVEQLSIPEGQSASIIYKGSYAELERAYTWFFGEWLPQSGYDAADFPPIEEYLNDPKTTPPAELLTKITCLLS